jgi:hypothetical protein
MNDFFHFSGFGLINHDNFSHQIYIKFYNQNNTQFSSLKLDKTARRFIQEAVYGIIASQSIMLTDIGRQLESRISLKKIEERFSRQLKLFSSLKMLGLISGSLSEHEKTATPYIINIIALWSMIQPMEMQIFVIRNIRRVSA